MIEAANLGFEYPDGTSIFQDFNLSVGAGEAWAILGPSGCGKTTLLYLLAGLLHPVSGTITIDSHLLNRPRPKTGMILQDYGLLPWATVYENAALGYRLRNFYGPDGRHAPEDGNIEDIELIIMPWLERLGLSELKEHYPGQISGGQRQRTAIARTLALNPDIVLMDEPFASLDAPTRESLQDLLLELRDEGRLTSIIVTHAIEEAALLGRFILVLSDPPIHSPQIISNPHGASPSFRETDGYISMCRTLRSLLEPT